MTLLRSILVLIDSNRVRVEYSQTRLNSDLLITCKTIGRGYKSSKMWTSPAIYQVWKHTQQMTCRRVDGSVARRPYHEASLPTRYVSVYESCRHVSSSGWLLTLKRDLMIKYLNFPQIQCKYFHWEKSDLSRNTTVPEVSINYCFQ